ncbi:MAG: hypothetical protein K1Y01_20670 [Vicinamibacteria bacterium]|nr:hypothetical protein [Vicinamibacteria bacterium]
MHKNVEVVIGRLATDSKLLRRFSESPSAVLSELIEQGLELTDVEFQALAVTNGDVLGSIAQLLDRRLRKA